jgi:hypothetical protein
MTHNPDCEICGSSTSGNGRYIFLVEVAQFAVLDSSKVVGCREETSHVLLSDGYTYQYELKDSNYAYRFKDRVLQHFVCSQECLNDLCKCPVTIRSDIYNSTPVFSAEKALGGLYWPMGLKPSGVQHNMQSCEICGQLYPDPGYKSYKVGDILSVTETHGNPQDIGNNSDYDYIECGTSGPSAVGPTWCMYFDKGSPVDGHYCSDYCVFKHCVEQNKYVTYPNLVMQAHLTLMSPVQQLVNATLGNSYSVRPTKLMPLP